MKISIAQLNYHVGNFEKNRELICNVIRSAKADGAEIVVFSELAVTGYPPLDLLDHIEFIRKTEETVNLIAAECKGIIAIAGAPVINTGSEGKKLFNTALVLSEGKIIHTSRKALLPTYDIFDEYRHFEPGTTFSVFRYGDLKIALTICEDLWDEQPFENEFEKSRLYSVSPMDELAKQDPDIIINISASPFSYSRIETRNNIFINKAKKHRIPVIDVNQTGANTELIFHGGSIVVAPDGSVFTQLPFFEECLRTIDIEKLTGIRNAPAPERQSDTSLIYKALKTGISDYFSKSGFKKAVLGLSGGIDSAVVLCLAADALGSENVSAILMPSRYSSDHSVSDAVKLAANLGTKHEVIPIEGPFSAFEKSLEEVFRGREADVTEENIQARVRAILLMAYSNKFGHILLNTSNKSEAAVGYGTLYGDMAGGISVIGDVYKTEVYRLAWYINRDSEVIPVNIIKKAPSAELRPGQFDTDSLPDYSILDAILHLYIEMQKPVPDIIKAGYDSKVVNRVIRMINTNEYKRYQAPPILRISSKAFGAGRRMPLVARFM
ncbi:MAG: NAD+ synthase [Bacteroidales bacterium]